MVIPDKVYQRIFANSYLVMRVTKFELQRRIKMYLYKITNLINNKKYIGITNDYKRRFRQHKGNHNPKSLICKAIQKYKEQNFKFEILQSNLSIEEACQAEIKQIKKENSLTPNGYNIAKGGNINIGSSNGKAKLTDEEVQYIKDNRNIPMYVLYDEFSDKISYDAFKKIYHNQTYIDIQPHVDIYPYNLEFSNQFTSNNKLDYGDVVELRKAYAAQIPWREIYEKQYKKLYPREMDFWNIYVGNIYKLVMPQVFTKKNKHFQASVSHSGQNNGRAKLTKEDVIKIRKLHEEDNISNSEIYKMYPQVSTTSIRNIINYKTWKNL